MTPLLLAFAAALATLLGGFLPLYTPVKKMATRYLLGFAAGVMLSVALLEMLPELAEEGGVNYLAVAAGFFLLYLVEKLGVIHSCPEGECEVHTLPWTALIGIATESLLDGAAIAIGFAINPVLGGTIALAVIAHEFPRGFTTGVIMRLGGYRQALTLGGLALDAFLAPLGAALVLLGVFPEQFSGVLLAFAAGTFLYVGAADLLPEAHRRFNIWVVASVMVGVLLIPVLEPFAHIF